jgi:hypothetical protein
MSCEPLLRLEKQRMLLPQVMNVLLLNRTVVNLLLLSIDVISHILTRIDARGDRDAAMTDLQTTKERM